MINLPHKFEPRWYQEPFLTAWDKGIKRLMLVAHRRCLRKGTKIAMSDGGYKNIEDVKIGDHVLSYDKGKLVSQKVLNVFDNGEKLVYRYNELYATPNHEVLDNRFKFTAIDESKHLVNAGELAFGNIHNPELAELLGLLLSDGHITKNQTPKFTNYDPVLLDRFEYLLSKSFPECVAKRYNKNKTGWDIVCPTKVKTNYHPIRKYFKTSNTMPDIVWSFDKESTLAFLSGAISGDGSFYLISSKVSKTVSEKEYLCGDMVIEGGISPKLAEDYKLILMKFGIRAHIKKDPRGNNTRVFAYSLKTLHGLKGIRIYSKHKQESFDKIIKNTKPFNRFRLELIHKDLDGVMDNVYDLEVENTHNYVANGYVVHNCGKDKMVIANVPKKMIERVGTYFYFLPTYNQARKVMWNGADKDGFPHLGHIPKELIADKNEQEMRIRLVNGSILQFVGADSVDRIVGTNPVGVVFSEYSLMKPEVWNLISPILAENDGWAVFIFTPRGQNHAYKLMSQAKNNPKWYTEILPVSKTGALSQEALLEQQMMMSEALYKQEYECSFAENASAVFKNLDACLYNINGYQKNENGIWQLGVDLAKKNDYTVIAPFDLTTFTIAPYDRFNQIDYVLQKAKIENVYLNHNKARVVMDATGVGTPVIDDLLHQGINVTPFTFTFNSRNELLMNLQLLIEQGKIKLPDTPDLRKELEAAFWDLTAQGRSRITVPEEDDQHDDIMMALALAVWDIPINPINVKRAMKPVQTGGVQAFYPELGL